jgi:lysophospholipase L1-like esterase
MSPRVRCLVTLVGAVLLTGATGASGAAAGTRGGSAERHPLYVALGDSWAAGVGASLPSEGYVPQLHAALQRRLDCRGWRRPGCKRLELVNLAQGGATAPSLIESQLPAAVALLMQRNRDRDRRNDVKVVTLHIGGNDVVPPILAACSVQIDATCVEVFTNAMAEYRRNLRTTLGSLRAAGGDRTRIVIGTYDNMLVPPCPVSPPPGNPIQEGSADLEPGLYDVMRQVARRYRAEVAEVVGSFEPGDMVGDCRHPNDSGYDKVTQVFLDVLRARH